MLNRMGGRISTTQQVYRARSSVRLAVVCAVMGLFLLVSLARDWADSPRPLAVSWVLLVLAGVWSIFVRPAVLLDAEGVTIRNVLRDVHIPWALLTYADARWSLKLFVGDRGYTAWAISSQIDRPKPTSGGSFGLRRPSSRPSDRLAKAHLQQSLPDAKVTASTVARSIEQAKRDVDEAMARGQLPVPVDDLDGRVQVTWVPLVLLVVLLPAFAVVVFTLV